jgi:broad specificity phosphatase PhoE
VILDLTFETHSTSLDNEAGLASGWFDVDLSPLGERQARELGQRRRYDVFDAVYCSDSRRTSFTAQIAFGGRGIPIVPDSRLRECHYGALTRRPSAEVDSRRVDHISIPFPGGRVMKMSRDESKSGSTRLRASTKVAASSSSAIEPRSTRWSI